MKPIYDPFRKQKGPIHFCLSGGKYCICIARCIVISLRIIPAACFFFFFFSYSLNITIQKLPDDGASGENPDVDPTDLLLLCSDSTPTPRSSPPPPPRPPSSHSSHSPPIPGPRIWPHTPTGRGQRGRAGRGQLFDDPAVVKTVEGRPSLKVYLPVFVLFFLNFRNAGVNIN